MPTYFSRSTALAAAAVSAVLVLAGCSGSSDPDGSSGGSAAELSVDGNLSVRLLPPIAANGSEPAAADDAEWVVEVQLKGAKAGQEVDLEAASDEGWDVVDTQKLDKSGRTVLTGAAESELRVVSDADAGEGSEVLKTADAPAVDLSDEFDELDTDLWATRFQGYAGVRQCSKAADEATDVADGVLTLSVLDDPDQDLCTTGGEKHKYRLNGHIGTQGTYEFSRGFAAARVKFQPERGQHGAFWLQTPWPGGGSAKEHGAEIDIVEYFGDGIKTGGLTSFAYWSPDGKPTKVGGWIENPERLGKNWSKEYHVFSVEWTEDEYIFRIDGKESFRTDQGVSGVPQFLVLSLLSSDYELQHGDDADLPVEMQVDWVRTWGVGESQGTTVE